MTGSRNSRPGIVNVNRIARIAIFVAALTAAAIAPAVADAETYSGRPINLALTDVDLQGVLATFSQLTDYVFAVDAQTVETGVLDLQVSAVYESAPWDRVLDEILTEAGLDWTLEGKVLWIHLPSFPPAGDRNFTGDVIKLRLDDAKLVDVLSTMSKVSGLEIDFDPDLDDTVSVRLQSVPWDQVLDLVLRISGFAFAQEGDAIEVYRVSDAKGMQLGVTSGQ